MPSGQLIVLTGPSGVGKGTLVRSLLARYPQLYLSISATTRSPRSGEVEGRDYFFLSPSAFRAQIEAEQFLEWAQYAEHYYGTPRQPVEERLGQGQSVLLEIEVLGAQSIQKTFPQATRIFVLPPSFAELERRLIGRAQDSPEAITRRLARAKEELRVSDTFDYQIVNDELEGTLSQLAQIIFSPGVPSRTPH